MSCSTLHREWGGFDTLLERKLSNSDRATELKPTNSFSVFNAAGIGFSSRDNLNCLWLLSDLKFDLIIDYSGINDARFNNCPIYIYRADYGQTAWGNEINCILRHKEINYTAIPFFIDYVCQLAYEFSFQGRFIPAHYSMRPNWLQYGSDLRSLKAFKQNIESIEELCKQRKEKLLLVPYCYYIPKDYSLEMFNLKKLDYSFCRRSREIETWGVPANVAEFLDSANNIVSDIAYLHGDYYLDPRPVILPHSAYFSDVCHFSADGLTVFTDLISDKVRKVGP